MRVGLIGAMLIFTPCLGWGQGAGSIRADPPSEVPGAASAESDLWFSLGAGGYAGQDYSRDEGESAESVDVGGAEGNVTLTYAHSSRNWLVRLRAAKLLDFTSNSAEEIAIGAGLPLGASAWVTLGVSRLTDVANDRQTPVVGAPMELIWFPVSNLEVLLHGNLNRHSNFVGVTVGWAFGRDGT
ncbi:MAG TPA: hypothetical protein VJM11_18545 [Nevskiaceae bacterium]|nr:hypothetical protein [Nevskiaceae bacterium]